MTSTRQFLVLFLLYWSYQIYNNIHDVEIDLCHQLNIKNNNLYNNNIFKIDNYITYYQFSIKKINNVNTDKIAIPQDKDILLQKSEEDGYYIVDKDGNIVAQYNSKGFDVALLSEHIKNLIKNINGIGFPDDGRLMLLNTIISSISENSWNLIDNNYNIAAKYDILGFDVAKINKHFKRLIDSVGFAEIAKLYSSDNPYGVNYTKYYIRSFNYLNQFFGFLVINV